MLALNLYHFSSIDYVCVLIIIKLRCYSKQVRQIPVKDVIRFRTYYITAQNA